MGKSIGYITDFHPDNYAVVVVDVQRDYADPRISPFTQVWGMDLGDADSIAQEIERFLQKVRGKIEIIFLKSEEHPRSYPKNLRAIIEAGALAVIGTQGHDFHYVQPGKGEQVFLKYRPSGFSDQCDLKEYLRASGKEGIIVVGGFTSRCVEYTVSGALSTSRMGPKGEGFNVLVLDDLLFDGVFPDEARSTREKFGRFLGENITTSKKLLEVLNTPAIE